MSNQAVDLQRFGWGGEGTNIVTIGLEVPIIGYIQVGIAWNDRQTAIIGSAALNAVVPGLLQEIEAKVLSLETTGLMAWEVFEALKTIEALQNGQISNLFAISFGKVNGYVEDLQGNVSVIGIQAGPVGGNILVPDGSVGGIADWFNDTPGAGWEFVLSSGYRLNGFLEDTQLLYRYGPSKQELENIALLEGFGQPRATPPDGWEKIIAPCFALGTPILLADGTSRPIEDIEAGEIVAAFAEAEALGRGALQPGTVTRLLPGITSEWIVLNDGTRVTPDHPCLTEHGTWLAARDLIASDLRAVAADGSLVQLRGSILRASDARSDEDSDFLHLPNRNPAHRLDILEGADAP